MIKFFLDEYCFEYQSTCARYLFCLGWSILIFLISLYCAISTYRIRQTFTYELAPLITNVLQSLLHAFQFSLVNDNHFALFINYLQIVTFAFLGQSFMHLYFRLIAFDPQSFKQFYRLVILISILFYLSMFIVILILNGLSESQYCNPYYTACTYTILGQLIVTVGVTVFFGIKLLNLINIIAQSKTPKKKVFLLFAKKQFRTSSNKTSDVSQKINPSFLQASSAKEVKIFVEKKQQIMIVCIGITFTCIFYIIFSVYALTRWESLFCEYDEIEDQSVSFVKNILIGSFFMVEITPCLYIPYVFYYIPIEKGVVDSKEESLMIQDIKIDHDVSLQPQDPFSSILFTDDLFSQRAKVQKESSLQAE